MILTLSITLKKSKNFLNLKTMFKIIKKYKEQFLINLEFTYIKWKKVLRNKYLLIQVTIKRHQNHL